MTLQFNCLGYSSSISTWKHSNWKRIRLLKVAIKASINLQWNTTLWLTYSYICYILFFKDCSNSKFFFFFRQNKNYTRIKAKETEDFSLDLNCVISSISPVKNVCSVVSIPLTFQNTSPLVKTDYRKLESKLMSLVVPFAWSVNDHTGSWQLKKLNL